MSDLNHVTLFGRLGRDPELRYLPNNTAICSFSIANTETWKKDGEKQERTNWIDIEVFGKLGEVINQYFRKGNRIGLTGRIRQDSWQDKDGNNRSKLKVMLDTFQFIEKNDDAGQTREREPSRQHTMAGKQASGYSGPHAPMDDENIPF